MEFSHKSVLLWECIDALNIRPNGIYLDGTLGGGGHSSEICRRLAGGHLIGIDQDEEALADGICRLIENPDLAEQLGRKARDICKIANGKAVFEQWQDYIESVCK